MKGFEMASRKVRNANQVLPVTLDSLNREPMPQDEPNQVVRASLIFVLMGVHRKLFKSVHPATQLALQIFNERGLTSLTRMQAVEVVKAYTEKNGGPLFSDTDITSESEEEMELALV